MNKKLNWKEKARHFSDFCHYRVMIKIKDIVTEKRTGFKGEVVNIRVKGCKTLFVVDFGRVTRSFTRDEIEEQKKVFKYIEYQDEEERNWRSEERNWGVESEDSWKKKRKTQFN